MGPQQEASLPQVAPISQTAPVDSGTPNIEAILATIAPKPVQQQVPMTITGHDSTPNIKEPQPHATIPYQSPIQGTATERKQATIHNSLAQLSNMFNQYADKQQQKKSDNLKVEVATIVKAQAQIDNANAVLANDPNNANAKAVIDQNKKLIEAKFEDKHLSQQLKKAFDVSFVDPEKNNTPEVKAAQAGIKEGEAAVKSGIAPNTPQEKQIQEQAAQGGKPAVPVAQGAATAPAASTGQSSTPYADQFLKQQPATIQMNPQYQQQQLNEQAREKQINQYVIPKVIEAYTKQQIEQLKQGGLDARTEYAAAQAAHRQMLSLAQKAAEANLKYKTEIQKQAMADSTRMAQTTLRVNAAMGAADAKGIKGTALQGKVQQVAIKTLDDAISSATKNNTDLATQQKLNRTDKGEVIDKDKEDFLRHQMEMNALTLNQYTDQRQKMMTKFYGKPEAGPDSVTGNTRGYVNVINPTDSKSNGVNLESVGGSSSDEDSDDAEDDAIVKSFDIDDQ